jgi:hypothetical protein
MTNVEKLKQAAELLLSHGRAHKLPGWDRKIEVAILTVFGDGDPEAGRNHLIGLALKKLE